MGRKTWIQKQETWLLNWLTVHGTTSTALKEKGVVTEEARADYKRFFEQEVYVPAGWSGTMPNGDKIQPGIKFIDIRTKYRQDPYYDIVYQAYLRGEAPVLNYHRFLA